VFALDLAAAIAAEPLVWSWKHFFVLAISGDANRTALRCLRSCCGNSIY
jgi:hypothetical protein